MGHEGTAMRRWYAEDLKLRAPVRHNMAIVDAFAAVPRDRFFDPGPWRILTERPSIARHPQDYILTPDDDPRWICHDVLVAIDPERGLNNGLPSFWARNFDHLQLKRGRGILQVGAGTGYYTAILAEIAGPDGHVIAVEYDEGLAARARASLVPWPQVEVVHGDGRSHDPGEVDVIIVFAGSTHPAPLTGDNRWGFLLLATRSDPDRFEATSIGGVGIFPCTGGRDEEAAKRFQDALQELWRGSGLAIPFEALHRGDPVPAVMDSVWYHAPGFWLERRKPT